MEKQFEREFKIDVPASGLLGDPPSREKTMRFVVPGGYSVKRDAESNHHGAVIVEKNLENLDEEQLTFGAIPNGVEVYWKLSNPRSFPVNGRTASMTVRLVATQEAGTGVGPALGFSDKYHKIRQRFFEDFYYAGLVAEFVEGNRIKFADQTIYMGQTLIFLASEVFIKRKIGEDPGPSIQKIREIFTAIEGLDRDAETLYGYEPALDGFVARDNIAGPEDPRLSRRYEQVDSDWQKPEDAAPSGDQIFGLLFGLWFVVKLVDDADVVAKAKELSDRMFLYAKQHKFELKLPDGKTPVERGADMRWLSSLLHGLNKSITGEDRFAECRIEVLGQELKLNPVAAFWDHAGDDAAEVLRTEVNIPGLGKKTINSFAAHILLMSMAPTEIWTHQQLEEAALSVNHHLAALEYALAHDTTPTLFGHGDVQAMLELCPDTGPRSDHPAETGWQKDNRWIRSKNIDEAGSGHKAYNGVDFLALHNLAAIVFAE